MSFEKEMFFFGCNSVDQELESAEEEEPQEIDEEENEEDAALDEYGLCEKDRSYFCSAFTLIDRDGDGIISPRTMGNIITDLGRESTQKNIDEIMTYCNVKGADGKPGMDFSAFYQYLATQLMDVDNKLELKNAFEIFDAVSPVDGSILPGLTDLTTLRHYLKYRGMKLTDEEIDYLWDEENNWMLEEKRIETVHLIKKLMERP